MLTSCQERGSRGPRNRCEAQVGARAAHGNGAHAAERVGLKRETMWQRQLACIVASKRCPPGKNWQSYWPPAPICAHVARTHRHHHACAAHDQCAARNRNRLDDSSSASNPLPLHRHAAHARPTARWRQHMLAQRHGRLDRAALVLVLARPGARGTRERLSPTLSYTPRMMSSARCLGQIQQQQPQSGGRQTRAWGLSTLTRATSCVPLTRANGLARLDAKC